MILDSPYISGSMSFGIANPSATMHISASTGAVLRVDGAGVTNTGSLFVSSSGNVGIGTAIPVSKLQVEGGALRIGDGAGSWSGFTFSGGLRQTNNNPLTILGELRVDSTAGNPSYISGSGGLGIGKTTANTRLDVNGNTLISGSINATGPITGSSFRTTGTITAQTLIVQTISSSLEFVTGSTKTGTLASNTHQFTGSVLITGSVGIGAPSPISILHVSSSSQTVTGKVILQSPNSDSGVLQIGSSYGEASMMFIPGVTSFGTSSPARTSTYGNAALWGLGPGTYTSDPTKFGIANVGVGNNILTVSSSGALGIGTTAPTSRLFVLGAGSYNTTTSEILTSDATIFSSEMSNDAYNSILQLVSVRQSLSTGASSNGFLGFSTIDDSNGEGIRDAGRIAIVNETAASRNSPTALSFWTNAGGTKTTAATEKLRIASSGAATFSSTIKATSPGVDGTYSDAFIAQYSSNNNETNAIQTAVSSVAASSGFRFQVSNGGGSSARTSMMDITRSGVKFQNGSSYLNYYEEGSWTPALQNATVSYSDRSGSYIRIGNYVFVRWGFRISSISGQSGTVTISGLPFTAVNWGSYQEPNISISTGVLATADNAYRARVYKGGSDTSLYGRVANNGDTPWTTADLQNGSWIIGELYYNV